MTSSTRERTAGAATTSRRRELCLRGLRLVTAAALATMAVACGTPVTPPPQSDAGAAVWSRVQEGLPGALLSVWGTSGTDVWTVGGDARDGTGPLVLHYDGSAWKRIETGQPQGDLWWVFGFEGGPIFMGGAGGVILRYEGGAFTKMTTPGTDTVFGLWGSSPDAMWAVGGSFDTKGFAWRLQSGAWTPEPSLPAALVDSASVWKVFGKSADDVWLVGSGGLAFHWNGSALEKSETGVGTSLFTVHANEERFVAVGGQVSGVIVENEGAGWTTAFDAATYGLTGVSLGAGDVGYAVGQYGSVYARDAKGWHEEDIGISIRQDLHGVWVDPGGGVWAVGGQTASFPLTEGLLLHKGDKAVSGGI